MLARRLLCSSKRLVQRRHALQQLQPRRCLSSTPPAERPVRILYASQTGTAQLFAHQLAEGLEDEGIEDVTVHGLDEEKPIDILAPGHLNLILASCTGKGEPPDNARDFYEFVMNEPGATLPEGVDYAVFGLGNESAHPNNYNVIGKRFDARLEELGGKRVKEMGLGDDGGCLEGDFDEWMAEVSKMITEASAEEAGESSEASGKDMQEKEQPHVKCPAVVAESTEKTRPVSHKHPTLVLEPAQSNVVRRDLFHLKGSNRFYAEHTAKLKVVDNHLLTSDAGDSSLHEMRVSLEKDYADETNNGMTYETGDHLLVYPRNSDTWVRAYLDYLGVDPQAIVSDNNDEAYPHPTGLTIAETLSHCIDLGAPPSPRFARLILGRKEVDYVNEIANPRSTVIGLCYQSGKKLSLEDLLFNAVPMKPRHYSIASSPLRHPDQVVLVYRPVHYVNSTGNLRDGVCTSFLTHKGAVQKGDWHNFACLPAMVESNPSFRLPNDHKTPVLFIGGGCGVAPIRGFIQERVALAESNEMGPATLFMGFRNPQDECYQSLVQKALDMNALTESDIVYYSGCDMADKSQMFVSDLVRTKGEMVWNLVQSGGHIYICGGAKTFGAKVDAALIEIFQERGCMDFDAALQYLRNLVSEGRLMEDLSN